MEIIGVMLLATLIEGFIEYFVDKEGVMKGRIKYLAAGIGIVVAIVYQIDLLEAAGLTTSVPIIGYVFSGLIISRGSNFVNDVISKIRQ